MASGMGKWWKRGAAVVAALLLSVQPALAGQEAPAGASTAARAPASALPRPAIWLLQDADTKIYLFGTIHILPPGFKWRSPALDRVVDSADELVVETYDPPGEDIWDEAVQLFFAEEPSPILERVPAEKRAALRAAIEAGPLPIEGYDMMQTWAAAMTLGLAGLLGEYGVGDVADAPGVEEVLEEAFRKAGKPIGSAEDPAAVLGAMNELAPEVQTELLVGAVDGFAAAKQESAEIDAAWAAGNAERMQIGAEDNLPPAMYDVLIRKRNAAWTQWLVDRLARPGSVLFAVGAGHLAGPDSVQRMLARRGLQARRLD